MIHDDSLMNTYFATALVSTSAELAMVEFFKIMSVRSINHFLTKEVIPDIDMFGVLVVLRVARQINGTLVVFKDWVGLTLDTQL